VYDADLIIVLKEGRVAEQGTHRQLIDRGGIYSELWSSESFLFCVSDADELSQPRK
jgi:ATP-binding cassette, subfamily B (MDR/TAP), member 7